MKEKVLHEDRLFSADPTVKGIAKELYSIVKDLPIISPHGHTNPSWYAKNDFFSDPATLFIKADHYIFRMLYSQGISLNKLGIPSCDGTPAETDNRKIWKLFAENYYLFAGTPSRMWLNHVFINVFGLTELLTKDNADLFYDTIQSKLTTEEFRPRALFERFNIEAIATTETPLADLAYHKEINKLNWNRKVITTFRPDNVIDPELPDFAKDIAKLGEITNKDTQDYDQYLLALRERRAYFKEHGGATATDHGHPNVITLEIEKAEAVELYNKALLGELQELEASIFRGHMLMQMAEMSLEDGLVMQLHPGVVRNHNHVIYKQFGANKGGDIPEACEFTRSLQPLLNKYGNNPNFELIVFTVDEDSYTRELAPLAGHYPSMKLGPAWWFNDSPEGMRRFREATTETAGFYNTVGFNDDTRAFFSIPARHDVARRVDCNFLAQYVAEHRITQDEAAKIIVDLTYNLPKKAYRL